jgi:hypothetical protein
VHQVNVGHTLDAQPFRCRVIAYAGVSVLIQRLKNMTQKAASIMVESLRAGSSHAQNSYLFPWSEVTRQIQAGLVPGVGKHARLRIRLKHYNLHPLQIAHSQIARRHTFDMTERAQNPQRFRYTSLYTTLMVKLFVVSFGRAPNATHM